MARRKLVTRHLEDVSLKILQEYLEKLFDFAGRWNTLKMRITHKKEVLELCRKNHFYSCRVPEASPGPQLGDRTLDGLEVWPS
jgi:hypothetical protein